jgi:Uma2 family endonuclease
MTTATQATDLRMVRAADGLDLDLAPLQGLWSVEQYLKLSNQTNHLIEFSDGEIEVAPMPTRRHQLILLMLYELLKAFVRHQGGIVLVAPMRLEVRANKFREPDVMLLMRADDARNQDAFWLGADLVIEIVSPDDPERDTRVKRADYAEAGIPEYWIVNPLDESVTVLALDGDSYAEHGRFGRGVLAASALMPGFTVSVDELFEVR